MLLLQRVKQKMEVVLFGTGYGSFKSLTKLKCLFDILLIIAFG
jgi:hypothetical protein